MLDSSPAGYLDAQERARAIESFVTQLRNALALLTPGILLGSSVLTAIVATAWPMRVLARGERIEKQRYLPLRAWHLSGSLALFATAAYVASLVISAFSPVSQTLSVGIALQFLSVLTFRVQGVASLERRLGATGMRPGMRGLITAICLLIWPFSSLFVYYGMASALFGPTYGVVTGYMQKRRARKGDGDDDDP